MRRSMSDCISSQMAYPHGRMTMVPRAGPFSASSARATTSWYHWGKSFPWGVSTALLATAGGLLDLAAAVAGSLLEQRRGQLPAVAAGERVVVAEDAEDLDHQLAGPLAALPGPLAHGGQQLGQGLVRLAVGGPPRGLGKARARDVGLARQQRLDELLDHLRRLRADELVDQPAVRDRLDRGNALHPEGGGELRRLVDVDPRQLHGPVAGHDRPLQQRPERAARRAPAG